MRIGVLTSSRADYYIYSPLLQKLEKDPFFDLNLLVFGTHLSKQHGYTVNEIIKDNYKIAARIKTTPEKDSPRAISESIGKTITLFSSLWEKEKFDLVIALGDRYEMFAAVVASVPFSIPIAHIHGGESTSGAIDNVFRHSISLMSRIHFTSAEPYKQRVIQLTGQRENIYNVGALSIENLETLKLLSIEEIKKIYNVDLAKPTILITLHPETVNYQSNKLFIGETIHALEQLKGYQFLITMPNADTMGNVIRNAWIRLQKKNKKVFLFENLGKIGYLSCMKHCSFMIGNSSSGFIEASFFLKPVVNLGSRQNGRIITKNIVSSEFLCSKILKAVKKTRMFADSEPIRIYGSGNTSEQIINYVKANFRQRHQTE
jgi:GDP/UDP-N,N'-diacetylbacillosamine 2-epimerase (hydrolysing)